VANDQLKSFCDFVQQVQLKIVQEIYTQTFDLQGFCNPYVGQYLFGESYKRSWFMARLNQGYREHGFSSGIELPDHLAVILRFLALGIEDEFCMVLKTEGAIPAVEKMLKLFDDNDENPYKQVLMALTLVFMEENLPSPMSPIELEKET
jgi:nitrate reductase assembly molybdenum cofactor insertion protein NarJ